jgi:hypothetical protein
MPPPPYSAVSGKPEAIGTPGGGDLLMQFSEPQAPTPPPPPPPAAPADDAVVAGAPPGSVHELHASGHADAVAPAAAPEAPQLAHAAPEPEPQLAHAGEELDVQEL